MFAGLFDFRNRDVLFVSSSPVDEVWTRSTALRCHAEGLKVEVALCCDRRHCPEHVLALYRQVGVKVRIGLSLAAAARLRCRLAVTASSGLDRKIFPTRARSFIHMPHSLASLHMIYPAEAFDGYDVLFAAGPHHEAEFEAIARTRGLGQRAAYAVGYGKLDVLAQQQAGRGAHTGRPRVLLAPSWGPDNLLDRCGVELAQALLAAGLDVVVRPHPLFFLDRAPVLDVIRGLVLDVPGLHLESPFTGDDAIFDADVLVGDYSGIGFEFAALRGRPVVSVNVGLKVANPAWPQLGLEPVEIACRAQIGTVVEPVVSDIVAAVQRALAGDAGVPPQALEHFLHGRTGDCAVRATARIQELLTLDRA
ncbi:UNVERIFIED_ORG: hypothetical protein HNP28_002451 [Comamonas terrigena]